MHLGSDYAEFDLVGPKCGRSRAEIRSSLPLSVANGTLCARTGVRSASLAGTALCHSDSMPSTTAIKRANTVALRRNGARHAARSSFLLVYQNRSIRGSIATETRPRLHLRSLIMNHSRPHPRPAPSPTPGPAPRQTQGAIGPGPALRGLGDALAEPDGDSAWKIDGLSETSTGPRAVVESDDRW